MPRVTDGTSLNWLPEIRVDTPPAGERVVPERHAAVSLQPMAMSTTQTEVASGRGNAGMVIGITFGLPQ